MFWFLTNRINIFSQHYTWGSELFVVERLNILNGRVKLFISLWSKKTFAYMKDLYSKRECGLQSIGINNNNNNNNNRYVFGSSIAYEHFCGCTKLHIFLFLKEEGAVLSNCFLPPQITCWTSSEYSLDRNSFECRDTARSRVLDVIFPGKVVSNLPKKVSFLFWRSVELVTTSVFPDPVSSFP